ncbi:hypothetical protein RI578_39590 [Streptomyces sp. BB1-1-1]|uniref:hypothetical protein n=1 Tax=Streptomyces sp. BB1-1-1 TaxID=3074430 RepID=UPI002877D576|nr:hypothetical protein [Streptomyces sp. BB1-1-1]WND39996.1 hypothetical protein RI578_39590 [Streptomyces sp. BB1-1-1]
MNRLRLRLAGSIQSRDERSMFTPDGDPTPYPIRSALLSPLTAAQGITRHTNPSDYAKKEAAA